MLPSQHSEANFFIETPSLSNDWPRHCSFQLCRPTINDECIPQVDSRSQKALPKHSNYSTGHKDWCQEERGGKKEAPIESFHVSCKPRTGKIDGSQDWLYHVRGNMCPWRKRHRFALWSCVHWNPSLSSKKDMFNSIAYCQMFYEKFG